MSFGGLLDSLATLAGPLLAAVLLEFTDVAVVFAVASGASLAAAALLLDCTTKRRRDPQLHQAST